MSHRPETHPEAFPAIEAFLQKARMARQAKAAFRGHILKGENGKAAALVPTDQQPEYRAATIEAYRARCGKEKFVVGNYMPTQGQSSSTVIFHARN